MKELFDVCKERAETVTYTLKVSTVDTSQHLILPLKSKRVTVIWSHNDCPSVCCSCVSSHESLFKKRNIHVYKKLILSKRFTWPDDVLWHGPLVFRPKSLSYFQSVLFLSTWHLFKRDLEGSSSLTISISQVTVIPELKTSRFLLVIT